MLLEPGFKRRNGISNYGRWCKRRTPRICRCVAPSIEQFFSSQNDIFIKLLLCEPLQLIHKDTLFSICERFHPENPEIKFTHFAECTLSPENATYLANISAKGATQKADVEEHLELFLHTAIAHLFYKDENPDNASSLDINTCISDILLKLETPEYLLTPIAKVYTQYPICRATLIKSFKQYTGYTIVEYRNKKRMEYAAMLLSAQKYSVTQIASMVGNCTCSIPSCTSILFFV